MAKRRPTGGGRRGRRPAEAHVWRIAGWERLYWTSPPIGSDAERWAERFVMEYVRLFAGGTRRGQVGYVQRRAIQAAGGNRLVGVADWLLVLAAQRDREGGRLVDHSGLPASLNAIAEFLCESRDETVRALRMLSSRRIAFLERVPWQPIGTPIVPQGPAGAAGSPITADVPRVERASGPDGPTGDGTHAERATGRDGRAPPGRRETGARAEMDEGNAGPTPQEEEPEAEESASGRPAAPRETEKSAEEVQPSCAATGAREATGQGEPTADADADVPTGADPKAGAAGSTNGGGPRTGADPEPRGSGNGPDPSAGQPVQAIGGGVVETPGEFRNVPAVAIRPAGMAALLYERLYPDAPARRRAADRAGDNCTAITETEFQARELAALRETWRRVVDRCRNDAQLAELHCWAVDYAQTLGRKRTRPRKTWGAVWTQRLYEHAAKRGLTL